MLRVIVRNKATKPLFPPANDELLSRAALWSTQFSVAKPPLPVAPVKSPRKRPNPMVEVPLGKKRGISRIFSKIFGLNPQNVAKKFRRDKLKPLRQSCEVRALNTDHATNMLYWYCVDLSFMKSDFSRLLPAPDMRTETNSEHQIEFQMTRARNPVNLTKWMGYFLQFNNKEDALIYYKETLGAELAGMPLKFRFVDPSIRGFDSPLLHKVPGLGRRCHALILGLPHGFSYDNILQVLWDYELVEDDKLAVERLPVDKVRYGGSPFLIRFKTEEESARFVHDFDKVVFPHSDSRVYCEIID